ncbi:NADP-dependent oxidoreductase [Hymenobacter terricola]|uniref:NADP-dependent oxidoreductase n=1 Tax=Hymenobacter terricola TaxID=2819236 RepID=UPI001B30563C|nr:NADP-dependent oxidoreductase [Hymenobacter terricola]
MKAFHLTDTTGIADLHLMDVPVPTPARGEVLVRVRAISLGPIDVNTTNGHGAYHALQDAEPMIPGWDISGEVVAVGPEVLDFLPGDAVFGAVNFPGPGRGYAEYVAAPARHLAPKPANISHAEAAAASLAALTAWQALMTTANVQPGQRVLIHGAGGGVGHFAVQLAGERGAYVIGTSSASKRVFVLSLGADAHVDYTRQRFEDVVPPVDVVLDAIGGETALRSLAVLKPGGLLISLPIGLSPSLLAQARARGVRGQHFLAVSNGEDMRRLAARLAAGTLYAHVARTWPFAQLPDALCQVAGGHTQGKISVLLD